MSKSVVPAAAVAHAKHLVNNKKLTKQVSGKKPADTDAQAVDHKDEAVNAAAVHDAQHSMSMSDAAISEFSFAGALASAASSTSALAAEGAQDEGGYSDDDNDGSGTIVAIGAAGLAILGGVVAFSGGGKSNKPPTVSAATQTVTTKEDTAATVTVSASDPNSDPLTYSASGATKGTVSGGTNGVFTYTPNANFNGTDTFTVTVNDGKGGTATQTVTVTVTAVNDAPVVDKATVAVTGAEDTAITGQTVATDADGTALTYTVTQGANGTVTIGADGKYTYTPKANFNGTDTFTVKASDGTDSVTQTVNVTVTPVADNPVADAINTSKVTVAEDNSAEIIVAFTDPDAPTDTNLKFAVTDTPDKGTLTTNAAGNLVYTPNADFNGTDAFTYTITDNNGGTTTVTVPITVTPVNDAPVLADIANLTANGGVASFTPAATDVDSTTLTFAATDPAGGTVTKNADGSFTYKADTGFAGADTFTLSVDDGSGGVDSQVVTVQVGPSITTKSIDIGNPSDPATTVNANDASYIFTDDAKVNTNVGVFGFGSDDTIKVSNATSADYNYTAANGDLIISFNNGAQVNLITIEDVLATNAVVFNYATAQSAIGNPTFMTFG